MATTISYKDLAETRKLKNDERLAQILRTAARIMADEGYERATIRKVARAVDASIASLYYYFRGKEELLFQIQLHTFRTLVENLQEKLRGMDDPEEKIRALIRNHLDHFFRHLSELKVCSHELETLTGDYFEQVRKLRTLYFKIALGIVQELLHGAGNRRLEARFTTLNLFGMLDWIYTWYRPESGPTEQEATDQITRLFLDGIRGGARIRSEGKAGTEEPEKGKP
jgi:AcrR family transcriptional regulator